MWDSIRNLPSRLFGAVVPTGSPSWYFVQDLLAPLPRWLGRSSLHAKFYELTLPGCGKGNAISAGAYIWKPENVRLGSGITIARGVQITGHDQVVIGDGVLIGPGTVINSGDHRFSDPGLPIKAQGHRTAPITVGDDSWIGANCTVLRGAVIGTRAVVAAGSVVRSEIPPFSLAAGVPAVVKKTLGAEPH